jgi:putative drug exporter of the RND superfamily
VSAPRSSRRRAWAIVLAALLGVCALGYLGRDVEHSLRPTSLEVPGTRSAAADRALHRYFGDSAPFVVLLRGPSKALESQGRELVGSLRAFPRATVVSPWDHGAPARLRPGPDRALILVDFHVDAVAAVQGMVPDLDDLLSRKVSSPVRATQTGYASLSGALQDESISGGERGELIALPVLLVILLVVFRSPLAALIPLAFGAATVLAARGVLGVVASTIHADAFALIVSTMMGLALGVDYSLLIVSRFREELAAGAEPAQAAAATRGSAGRTILFAASTLAFAMAVCVPLLPGALLVSLAGTLIIVVAISAAVATIVAPALLTLLGPNIDRWRIGSRTEGRSRLLALVDACLRRPLAVTVAIGALVLALAAPGLAIRTGPPSPEQLPTDNSRRQDAEEIDAAVGPGWEAPFVLVASVGQGTITESPHLAEISRFQRGLAADPAVQLALGPAQVLRRVASLKAGSARLLGEGRGGGPLHGLRRLGPRLGEAERAVAQIRAGLGDAADGAGLLGIGSGRAEEGAGEVVAGLGRALGGGERAVAAIGRIAEGSGRLARAQGAARAAALAVELGVAHLLKDIRRGALQRARRLEGRLRRAARSDPELEPPAAEAKALVEHLLVNGSELRLLRGEAARLHAGESKLLAGAAKLHGGAQRLAASGRKLPAGIEALEGGARRLAAGLARLRAGALALEEHLGAGAGETLPLQSGLRRASAAVTRRSSALGHHLERLKRRSPGLTSSGYLLLSALDGAPKAERRSAAATIDLDRGGQAAAILVVPRSDFNTAGLAALYQRLRDDASALTARTGIRVGVSGGAAQLSDYATATRAAIPLVILAITAVTFLVMLVVLRAVPLAALAVALNLAIVGAAFGVVTLLSYLPAGYPLGGHSYIDTFGAAAIFGVVSGLSIDYAVFLLSRVREHHDEGAGTEESVRFALERTAGVITGAAAIMTAVFVAFATAPIATIAQFGVGLTVAVLLDATVVRIVLLPALMLLLGDRIWWLPKSLEGLLPRIDLHGGRRTR